MTSPQVSWDEAFLGCLRCRNFTSPGDSWVSGWLCREWDCIFPMFNATQEMRHEMWHGLTRAALVFRASFSQDKSLAQQTCTESLLHSRCGPGHQGCRWTGVHGLMRETHESPDMHAPLGYVCPSRPGKSLIRKRLCDNLTCTVRTSPMRDETLNLDRQVGVAPAKKWGRSLLAERVR